MKAQLARASIGFLAVACVAVLALVWVLVLLARQRRETREAQRLVALSRELRHRYDVLQSVTREGVMVQSLDGRVLDMSHLAAQILGVDTARTLGRTVTDLPLVLVNEQGLSMNPAAVLGCAPGRATRPSSSASSSTTWATGGCAWCRWPAASSRRATARPPRC